MNLYTILFFLGMIWLMLYSFFFSSFIAFLVIWFYIALIFFLNIRWQVPHQKKELLFLLFISSCIMVLIKTLALKDIFIVNYRVNNTIEHINLLFGLGLLSYMFCERYIRGKMETFGITFLWAFSMSVVLEIAQYFYREHYDLVSWKSHGLYNDSMVDMSVNFWAAFIISCILLLFFSYKHYESDRK